MTLTLNQNMVDNDWLPPFSLEEYERRFALVRAGMKENGLDALVIYGAHAFAGRDLGQINAVYLSNYAAFIQTYVVVPLHDEPTVFVPIAQHIPNAKDLSCLTDIRNAGGTRCEFGVSARLKEVGLERGKIGIVGPLNASWWTMSLPVEARDHFAEALPEAGFRVVTELYEQWRLIKSAEELEHQRRGASINDAAQEAIIQATKPGVSHHELSEAGYATAQKLRGNTAYIHLSSTSMTSPAMTYPDPYPTHKKVGRDEVVLSEHSVGFGGYYGKLMTTWFTGEPTKEYRALFDAAAELYRTALAELKPGMTNADADRLMEPLAKAGYTVPFPLVSGWSAYNSPPMAGWPSSVDEAIRNRTVPTTFEPGMAVRISVNPHTQDRRRALWVASACVFTETGLESLHEYDPATLRIVPDA
ncbi:M24 family metallopeptidase [Amycolatopsis pithecellobii]|uniref:M24 family metallopeptidase n=1 Tax=Amycolatopsis pithecellobii TaxID=664692 RepID=A0A6N7YL95_9PSEU|nr:M24 family metallopeptidase [Amycolatopsis pithecellobii]MTD53695.1 M24 family metallopeptidase [Amycolatopsis pithecellobii]